MASAEAYRDLVAGRAGGACEYCRLLQSAAGVTFHLEHVLPRAQGGETELSNLALSCPGCNLAKGERTHGTDFSGKLQRVFNPRDFEPPLLGWHMHFQLDRRTGLILPKNSVGEATVNALRVNATLRVSARRFQMRAGLIS